LLALKRPVEGANDTPAQGDEQEDGEPGKGLLEERLNGL